MNHATNLDAFLFKKIIHLKHFRSFCWVSKFPASENNLSNNTDVAGMTK